LVFSGSNCPAAKCTKNFCATRSINHIITPGRPCYYLGRQDKTKLETSRACVRISHLNSRKSLYHLQQCELNMVNVLILACGTNDLYPNAMFITQSLLAPCSSLSSIYRSPVHPLPAKPRWLICQAPQPKLRSPRQSSSGIPAAYGTALGKPRTWRLVTSSLPC
jgi:hypothetical protein